MSHLLLTYKKLEHYNLIATSLLSLTLTTIFSETDQFIKIVYMIFFIQNFIRNNFIYIQNTCQMSHLLDKCKKQER